MLSLELKMDLHLDGNLDRVLRISSKGSVLWSVRLQLYMFCVNS